MKYFYKLALVILMVVVATGCKDEKEQPKGSGLTLEVDGESYFYKVITSQLELGKEDIVQLNPSCFTSGCFNTYRLEPSSGPFDYLEMEIKTENTTFGLEDLAGNTFTPGKDEDEITFLLATGEISVIPDERNTNIVTVFSVTQMGEEGDLIEFLVRGNLSGTYVNPETEETYGLEGSFEFPAFVSPE